MEKQINEHFTKQINRQFINNKNNKIVLKTSFRKCIESDNLNPVYKGFYFLFLEPVEQIDGIDIKTKVIGDSVDIRIWYSNIENWLKENPDYVEIELQIP